MTRDPVLSVIVPTYNRSRVLGKCLEALLAQTCDLDAFEVVVSDDGSPDDTRETVERFAAGRESKIRYLHQPNSGANAARNRAILAARAGIILLINDDTIPSPGMLAEHLAAHERYPDECVAVLGRVTVSPDLPPSRLAALHLDCAFERLGKYTELDWRSFFTCNVSAKKSLLVAGGLFEEGIRYHEDLELSERLSHLGLRVIYRPAALGYHDHLMTEKEFLAVAQREARALAVWARKAPHLIPVLAEFGFEPALPASRRAKHRIAGWVVNRRTVPLWCAVARRCPVESIALKIYSQLYQSVKRRELRKEWREEDKTCAPLVRARVG